MRRQENTDGACGGLSTQWIGESSLATRSELAVDRGRILCAKSGNPITILDEDIGVLPPSRLPHEPEIGSATVLLHYTELSRILGKIMKGMEVVGGLVQHCQ